MRIALPTVVLATFATAACAPAAVAQSTMPPAARGAAAARPAQPPASPRDTARGTVGNVRVLVDYGRPYKKGRVIFAANGLVPFGQVWRTGANAATTLVISGDLMVGTARLPAGTYTLYSVPSPTQWQLVINKQTGQWGTVYDATRDFARVPMTVTKVPATEQFTVSIDTTPNHSAGSLTFRWDTTEAAVLLRPATPR